MTWVLVQFLELTLRCWHEILHCKAKAALTSCRGPRVYMRVRVSVCECASVRLPPLLRLESWIWRSSWLCSVTHTQHQTRDESGGVGAAPRPRPGSIPTLNQHLICWGQDQRRWRWSDAGRGEGWLWQGWADPRLILIKSGSHIPTENHKFQWIQFALQHDFAVICI